MIRITLGVVVLLASTPAVVEAAATAPEPGTETLPPTALGREENNPAKAAVKVSEALKAEKELESKDISVTTHAGTIVLTGEVGSSVEAERARATAESAAEGARVSNNIEVRPGPPSPAAAESARLARSVEDALGKDARTANLGISVSVDEKHVIGLHGLVPSKESRTAAESVASKAAGSSRVRSYLTVP